MCVDVGKLASWQSGTWDPPKTRISERRRNLLRSPSSCAEPEQSAGFIRTKTRPNHRNTSNAQHARHTQQTDSSTPTLYVCSGCVKESLGTFLTALCKEQERGPRSGECYPLPTSHGRLRQRPLRALSSTCVVLEARDPRHKKSIPPLGTSADKL